MTSSEAKSLDFWPFIVGKCEVLLVGVYYFLSCL